MADPLSSPKELSPALYRYLIILIGFVTLAGASGVSSSFSVFYSALLQEFDWSHAGGASVYSVNQLVLAASAPLMGGLLDRFGPRWLFPGAATLVGVAWMACGTLNTLGQFMLFYGVLSALGQTALSLAMVVVSRWFQQTHRGRAIGLADVGTGCGHVLFVPGAAWLITTVGWRWAFIIVGATVLAVLVPLNLLHRPTPVLGAPSLSATTLRGALRTRALWMLCLAHLCMTITMTMVNVHLVNFLVGTGTLQNPRRFDGIQRLEPGQSRRKNLFWVVGRPAERRGSVYGGFELHHDGLCDALAARSTGDPLAIVCLYRQLWLCAGRWRDCHRCQNGRGVSWSPSGLDLHGGNTERQCRSRLWRLDRWALLRSHRQLRAHLRHRHC